MKTNLAARMMVFKELCATLQQHEFLPKKSSRSQLSEADAAFADALQKFTLRHLGTCRAIARRFVKVPMKENSAADVLLCMGMTQLLFMDGVPDHAAINTTVTLAKEPDVGLAPMAGLMNAVLRQCQQHRHTLQHTTTGHNAAPWLVQEMQRDYGKNKAAALLADMVQPAPLHVFVRQNKWQKVFATMGSHAAPVPGAWHITTPNMSPTALPGWAEGDVYAQNIAVQLPAYVLASLKPDAKTVLDLCAAPGGKSIQLHTFLPKADIVSVDNSAARLNMLHDNFARCHVQATVLCADATALDFPDNSFDAILLDAPCSATGTSRHHPEVLWNKTKQQVEDLILLQRQLLQEAFRLLRPQGVLVYATCSVLKSEGETQVMRFLTDTPQAKLLPVPPALVGAHPWLNTAGMLRCLPVDGTFGGVDGFFAAVISKTVAGDKPA